MSRQKTRETNAKHEIKHRVDRLSRAVRSGQIEKSKNFKDYDIARVKLDTRIDSIKATIEKASKDLEEAEELKKQLIEARKLLGDENEIVVTEHAMLRYAERFLGVDMDNIYESILKLPKKDVTKYGNTIVTVYPVAGEHSIIDEKVDFI